MKIDLNNLTIQKAHDHLVKGDFSAVELAEAYLSEISKKNKDINAYLEIYEDVKKQAEEADKMIKAGKGRILTGIPLALKDNILRKGNIASCASKILANYHATYDSTAIAKLKKEGVVFLGRTNMDEFAMGSSTQNSAYGVTKNPHDMSRVPGGSSGGAAAAVSMNGALAALGTDTGGSVRQPASFCGLVGLKPTYGSISRHGIIAMGSSLDQIGPITKTVTDNEILWKALRGKDIFDGTTISEDTYPKLPLHGKKKPIVGIPYSFMNQGIDKEVMKNFEESVRKLKSLGYEIEDISLPNIGYSLAVYYVLMPAEVSSNLARFDGVKYGLHAEGKNLIEDYVKTRAQGFGPETRRRVILGTYVLSHGYADAYYNKANQVKALLQSDFEKVYKKVDLVLTPTTPTPAFKIGEKTDDPVQMYLADIFTVTANIVGGPALTVPSGFLEVQGKKLPLGIQFTAPNGREDLLFAVGKEFLGE
ncbi:MAG: Asp-tRNA(Asn)/Glu-tRNA(Gln) amidotransferase subunit GatA [Candidatus Pacebacteria bacterium]|nr:Asp-tRNA(Asn)/Glu-tRNA(Gln) amidotransferase subunit GatA [Candidatus Paceibacterota bacterium]